jgi:hypothetical protein
MTPPGRSWHSVRTATLLGPHSKCLAASIAGDLSMLAGGHRVDVDRLRQRLGITDGRGACSHPSGADRFIASGLTAYAVELYRHEHGAGCGRPVRGALPVGPLGPAINGGPRRANSTLTGHGATATASAPGYWPNESASTSGASPSSTQLRSPPQGRGRQACGAGLATPCPDPALRPAGQGTARRITWPTAHADRPARPMR